MEAPLDAVQRARLAILCRGLRGRIRGGLRRALVSGRFGVIDANASRGHCDRRDGLLERMPLFLCFVFAKQP